MTRYSHSVDEVTVKFGPTERSQAELRVMLGRALSALENKGLTSGAQVEPVFPGDSDMRWKGAFVVRFCGPVVQVVQALKSVPGIQTAYAASQRRAV